MRRAVQLLVVLGLCLAIVVPGCGPGNKTVKITSSNFEALVLQSKQPVLVDFWAVWCGPCRRMEPVIQELAADFEGKVVVGKLNIDENPDITSRYKIEGFPTYLLFKDGKVVNAIEGAVPKFVLRDQLLALR